MVTEELVTQLPQKHWDHDGYRPQNKLAVTYFRIYLTTYLGKLWKPTKHKSNDSPLFT
jgi:hypothetical protein